MTEQTDHAERAERLVYYRSPRTQMIEMLIGVGAGFVAALVVRANFTDIGLAVGLVMVTAMILVPFVNNMRMRLAGVPRIPLREMNRRILIARKAQNPFVAIAFGTLRFCVITGAMLYVLNPAGFFSPSDRPIVMMIPLFGLLVSLTQYMSVRRTPLPDFDPADAPHAAPAPRWTAILRNTPFVYAGIILGGAIAVFAVRGFALDDVAAMIVLMTGMLFGLVIPSIFGRAPLPAGMTPGLAGEFTGLVRTIVVSVVLFGIPMALYFSAVMVLAPRLDLFLIAKLFVATAIAGGVFFGGVMWLLMAAMTWSGGRSKDGPAHTSAHTHDTQP